MRQPKKILIALIVFTGLALVTGWVACSERAVDDASSALSESADGADIRKMLLELGAIRLRIVPEETLRAPEFVFLGRPHEFAILDRRRRLRESGYDTVWRDDRYILRDLDTGKEFDPFILGQDKKLQGRAVIDEDDYIREMVSSFNYLDWRMPDELRSRMYYYQLNGFSLVLRRSIFFDDKFLYVKNVRKRDLVIDLDQIILIDDTLTYGPRGTSEVNLKERGLMMKKRGDGYVPVSLETGAVPELPPREMFVQDALDAILEASSESVLGPAEIPVGSGPMFYERPYSMHKEVLDLYGIEIRWNEAEQRFEVVE